MREIEKVYIEKTPNADTRSIEVLDESLVYKDTRNHIEAVQLVMQEISNAIKAVARKHDYTKIIYFNEFFKDLSTKKTGVKFKELNWWQKHLYERHHLNDRCPEDVDLIDVLEMVVDCVCAGKARTGNVYPIALSDKTLQQAVNNTVELLKNMIEVKE